MNRIYIESFICALLFAISFGIIFIYTLAFAAILSQGKSLLEHLQIFPGVFLFISLPVAIFWFQRVRDLNHEYKARLRRMHLKGLEQKKRLQPEAKK